MTISTLNNKPGITLVVTTYRRKKSLRGLLKSVYKQKLDVPLEVVVVNNYSKHNIRASSFTPLGRVIKKFDDITIFNLTTNFGCSIRYSIATFSKYDTILLLDDDLELVSDEFIQKMYQSHQQYNTYDISSAWCAIFKDKVDYFDTNGFNFQNCDTATEVDLAGPGISLFRKELMQLDFITIPPKYRDVDNIWFSIVPSILYGSKKYYFPSTGMLKFVDCDTNAMFLRKNMDKLKRESTLELVAMGYTSINKKR
jgi:glycosyltransferase involved in cell wall biosynthesis